MAKLIKVSFMDNGEVVEHIGYVREINRELVVFDTKFGTMTIPIDKDTKVERATEEEYNIVVVVKEEQHQRIHSSKPGTKMEHAVELYKELYQQNNNTQPKRSTVISLFITELGMTPAGASTYQQTIKAQFN